MTAEHLAELIELRAKHWREFEGLEPLDALQEAATEVTREHSPLFKPKRGKR